MLTVVEVAYGLYAVLLEIVLWLLLCDDGKLLLCSRGRVLPVLLLVDAVRRERSERDDLDDEMDDNDLRAIVEAANIQ